MLYFIPTPIGNREDITLRSLNLLKSLSILICEDTRTTKKLLMMYEIPYHEKQFFSLTSFTDKGKLTHYLNLIKEHDVGMLSDAGTPGLSDPGKVLIQLCHKESLSYTILPGATALIPAVVAAGFDTSAFCYLGYLPQKKGRKTLLQTAIESSIPSFFYESVHRMEKLITELEMLGFEGKISISREISKCFEQHFTGNLLELRQALQKKNILLKGEFVVGLTSVKGK